MYVKVSGPPFCNCIFLSWERTILYLVGLDCLITNTEKHKILLTYSINIERLTMSGYRKVNTGSTLQLKTIIF